MPTNTLTTINGPLPPIASLDSTETDTSAALMAGAALTYPHTLSEDEDAVRVFVVPDGYRVTTIDPHEHTDTPGKFRPLDLHTYDAQSFNDACREYHTADRYRVFIDPVNFGVVAILNDDDAGNNVPGWGTRRVTLNLTHTPEWVDWTTKDGGLSAQETFVEFIEDHMGQIAEPAAADLYEIAQSLQATTSATFRSAVRLQSGTRQFHYSEDVNATAGQSGEIDIPETFVLGLAPWVGCDPVPVQARLRFRVGQSGLALGFRLVGLDVVLRDAFEGLVAPIREAAEFCVNGTP